MYRRTCFQIDTILCLFMVHFSVTILRACDCFNDTGDSSTHEISVNCLCRRSLDLLMDQKIHILTIKEFAGEIISAENFTNFKNSLVDVLLTELFNLKHISKNAFNQLSRLQSLYLSTAPALNCLSLDILENDLNKIRFLRVIRTGIRKVPRMRIRGQIMEMVDFERNAIEIIESNSMSVKANQVMLDYNEIETVEPWAFNNSEIYKISFKGNLKLRILSTEAFHGLKSLTVLDLSETSITNIPTYGLKELENLIIRRTYSLKTIPSIYDFDNLKEAELTFSFHCCAFNLPKFHNPERYAQHKARVEKMKNICIEYSKVTSASMNHSFENLSDDEEWHGRRKRRSQNVPELVNKTLVAYCGTVRYKETRVRCVPAPNAFNPCEDIMGYEWLRYCVWFVALTGLFGNVCVLTVILSKPAEMTVQNLLICNLAFSDLCMAIFLLMLAIVDLISTGVYFNFAYDWQRGTGCKVAGFVTIFSSQLSIFVLCLLTVERWFTIKRALYVNRLTFRITALITCVGWVHAMVMAALPLMGISSYSTTSLCLPMKTETGADTAYILFLLFSAFAAFVTICICYFQIYFSLSYETRHKDGEYVLARKMTILVATNFLCWAPITFFALTAVLGFPLINITNSKILLVFFYPLNSCANPFLYAILTTNFKRDFIYLLAKFGICRKRARKYKLIFYQPRANSKHPIQRPFTSQTSL